MMTKFYGKDLYHNIHALDNEQEKFTATDYYGEAYVEPAAE